MPGLRTRRHLDATSMTPYAEIIRFTYENVYTTCPVCGHENTFNRVSDLRDTRPIDCKLVRCHDCKHEFFINGDSISPTYQTLLFEAYEHARQKRYRDCTTTLATALESVLKTALQKVLVDNPFANEHQPNWDHLNALHERLRRQTENWTFPRLRNALSNVVTQGRLPTSTAHAEELITRLPRLCREVDEHALRQFPENDLKGLLTQLWNVAVPSLRNAVLHKDAYRPTKEEAEAALAQAEPLLYGVVVAFRLDHDDFFATLYEKPAR